MSDASGWTSWVYNERGLMVQETKFINNTGTFLTQYSYNSANLPTSITYPGDASGNAGEAVSFSYHPQMALNTANGSTTYVQGTTYDAAGRVDVRTLGNTTLKTDYNYYGWNTQGGRLQQLKSGTPGLPDSLQDLRYTYDPVGDVLTIQDYKAGSPQTQTFTYDALNRLSTAVASGGTGGNYATESYTYDSTTGNLITKAEVSLGYGAQSANYPNGALNKAHAAISLGASNTYCYDPNGNMRRRTISGTVYNLDYDAENQLTGVSGGATASFVYDGDGNRVKGTVGGVTTTYIGNYLEWTGSTSTMKRYYYAGATQVAMRVGNGSGTTGLSWLLGDHLGSTSITVDGTYTSPLLLSLTGGEKTGELRYKAWGEIRYTYGTTGTTYRYTGQRQESRLGGPEGLYYYRARWYDPTLRRFAQADTIIPGGGQGLDRYADVNNSPTNFTDPSGYN